MTTNTQITEDRILILDFGSQYSQLIARRVREAGVYSEMYAYDMSEEDIRAFNPNGIISVSYTHLTLPTKRIV